MKIKNVFLVVLVLLVVVAGLYGFARSISSDIGAHRDSEATATFAGPVNGYSVSYVENFQPFYGRARNELIIRGITLPDGRKADLLLQDQIGWHELPVGEINPSREYADDTLEVVVLSRKNPSGSVSNIRIGVDAKPGTYEYQLFEWGQSLYTELREPILVELQERYRDSLPAIP